MRIVFAAVFVALAPVCQAAWKHKKVFTYTGSDQKWQYPNGFTEAFVQVFGAGGGGGKASGDSGGGGGGYTQGVFKFGGMDHCYVVVGQGGIHERGPTSNGYGGGGRIASNYPVPVGMGGGRSALRSHGTVGMGLAGDHYEDGPVDNGNEFATAGGGGGGCEGSKDGYGGGGGGLVGLKSEDPERDGGGGGGTQTEKGAGGNNDGNQHTGKSSSGPLNGGGGGGWFGGGAGKSGNDKCGGGGSGYMKALVDNKLRSMKTGKMGSANTGGACADDSVDACGKGGNPGKAGSHGTVIIQWGFYSTTSTITSTTVTTVTTVTTTKTETSTTSTKTSTTNTDLQALQRSVLTDVEKALEDQVILVNGQVAKLEAKLGEQATAHQQALQELTSAFDAKLVALQARFEAAQEAAEPCAQFKSEVNENGVDICTMSVDMVKSLHTGDD